MKKIVEVGKDRLSRIIQDVTIPVTLTQNGQRPAHNVSDLVKYILAEPEKTGFPELKGLYHTPIVTPSRKLLKTKGYDAESKLYVCLSPDLPPDALDRPLSPDEAMEALKTLYCDFKFQDEQSGFAHTLAMAFSILLRPLIQGAIPGFAVLAAIPGTGKSLIVEVTTAIVTAERPLFTSFPSKEEEMSKTLITFLKEGKSLILFDNADKAVNSNALESFLTAPRFGGRLLGQNECGDYPNNTLVVINGNNPDFSRAMARRIIPIMLDSPVENPHERTNFRYPDIKKHILQEQLGYYLNALLTLVQKWLDAGAPCSKHQLGSFESWASIVGGLLEFHGIPGFLENLAAFQNGSDTETASWQALTATWYGEYGEKPVTPGEVLNIAQSLDDSAGLAFMMKDSFQGRAISLGKELFSKRNRIYGGLKIVHDGKDKHSGSQLWRLEPNGNYNANTSQKKPLPDDDDWDLGI